MADLGHDVVAVDHDEAKTPCGLVAHRCMNRALDERPAKVLPTGRLRFTTDIADAAAARVHFLCVGTPQRRGENGADTSQVFGAVEALAPHLSGPALIVGKSTVPVGTAFQVRERAQSLAPAGSEVHPGTGVSARGVRDCRHPGAQSDRLWRRGARR